MDFHSQLSSFPAVICVLLLCTELASATFSTQFKQKFLFVVLVLTVSLIVFIPLAYLSGLAGVSNASLDFQVPVEHIEQHKLWGKISLFLLIPYASLTAVRVFISDSKGLRWASFVILLVLSAIIFTGSLEGGKLITNYGAGVELLNLL